MTQPAVDLPSPAVSAAPLCSECGAPAVFSYTWAWGDTGYCCATHQVHLRQKASALKRTIQFVSLTPAAPQAITKDERINMHARVLAAEDEAAETKERNALLFTQNQTLIKDLGHMQVSLDECKAQLADARAEMELQLERYAELRAKFAETTDELARVKGILTAADG